MMISVVIMSILTGILTSKVGYYKPFLILGVLLAAIGAGLLTTLGINTSTSQWIGFQILYGFGFGFAGQAPNMAAQTVLPREDVPIGISLMLFGQQLFGAIFICVSQNVLDNQLANRLAGLPGITPAMIPVTGATDLLKLIPPKYRIAALEAYNSSLRVCFQVGLIMACLGILGGLTMEWRSVKKNLPLKASGGLQAAEEGKSETNDMGEKALADTGAERRDAQVSQVEGKKFEAAD